MTNAILDRCAAVRFRSSRTVTALALAAGLSLLPLAGAQAQQGSHHGHHEQGARKAPAKKGSTKRTPARQRQSALGAHAGHGASASDTPAVAEFKTAHASMMRGMDVPYTGDADADFRIQMIPHHQGAIDMAQVALRRAKDPWTRQLAEAVIVEQQREIAEMRAWLTQRGITAPQGGEPRHLLTASSYRSLAKEPGTREEAVGQSWAPGAGIPLRR